MPGTTNLFHVSLYSAAAAAAALLYSPSLRPSLSFHRIYIRSGLSSTQESFDINGTSYIQTSHAYLTRLGVAITLLFALPFLRAFAFLDRCRHPLSARNRPKYFFNVFFFFFLSFFLATYLQERNLLQLNDYGIVSNELTILPDGSSTLSYRDREL